MHQSASTRTDTLGKIGESGEASTLNSGLCVGIGSRKWSSQCGMVNQFGIWSASDFKSHVGGTMSFEGGKGSPMNISAKQKLNTESSTTVELVGVDCAPPLALWVPPFLMEQGCEVKENVI